MPAGVMTVAKTKMDGARAVLVREKKGLAEMQMQRRRSGSCVWAGQM
jgi:hypothetical protein